MPAGARQLGIGWEKPSPGMSGQGFQAARHLGLSPGLVVSVPDSLSGLLIVHWGAKRQFSFRSAGVEMAQLEAMPGDWTYIPPHHALTLVCDGPGPALFFWGAPVPRRVSSQAQITTGHDSELEASALQLVRALHKGKKEGCDQLADAFARKAAVLRRDHAGGEYDGGGLAPANLRRVTDYIASRLDEGLTLNDMAAVAELSPFHFTRSFKSSTGLTPYRFLTELRMRLAKQLLAGSTHKLAEIGRRCGYASQSRFTTVFRQALGLTPGEYRKLTRSVLLA